VESGRHRCERGEVARGVVGGDIGHEEEDADCVVVEAVEGRDLVEAAATEDVGVHFVEVDVDLVKLVEVELVEFEHC